jgi:multidrug resistance protein, MATE family
MSPAKPIPVEAKSHHHHASENLPFPSSYLATSPIAQEIIARDIEECSAEGEQDMDASDDNTLQPTALLSFHPSGIAYDGYGTGRPAVPVQGPVHPVPSAQEIEDSRSAERSLLRDNHFLPPKHQRTGNENALTLLYRWIFSTKVRELYASKAIESTPLLVSVEEVGPPTPNEEHSRWEAAVAANMIKTTWQREAKTLVQYAAPLILTFLLHYGVTIGSVLTVGRIGTTELAAVNCMFSSNNMFQPTLLTEIQWPP